LALAEIKSTDSSFVAAVRALGVANEELETGLAELATLVEKVSARFPGQIIADMKIARGLDYYTGNVFELELEGFPSLGTISAGGRYDSLASEGRFTYPGVGISFGLSRVFAPLIGKGKLGASRAVPSAILIAVDDEESRAVADEVATALRERGIPCEVSPNAAAYGKQIKVADRRGIPFVWFGGTQGSVKDIRTGDQSDANAGEWNPPAADLHPQVISNLE
jgi:histidyl-tRNA synthetase